MNLNQEMVNRRLLGGGRVGDLIKEGLCLAVRQHLRNYYELRMIYRDAGLEYEEAMVQAIRELIGGEAVEEATSDIRGEWESEINKVLEKEAREVLEGKPISESP